GAGAGAGAGAGIGTGTGFGSGHGMEPDTCEACDTCEECDWCCGNSMPSLVWFTVKLISSTSPHALVSAWAGSPCSAPATIADSSESAAFAVGGAAAGATRAASAEARFRIFAGSRIDGDASKY